MEHKAPPKRCEAGTSEDLVWPPSLLPRHVPRALADPLNGKEVDTYLEIWYTTYKQNLNDIYLQVSNLYMPHLYQLVAGLNIEVFKPPAFLKGRSQIIPSHLPDIPTWGICYYWEGGSQDISAQPLVLPYPVIRAMLTVERSVEKTQKLRITLLNIMESVAIRNKKRIFHDISSLPLIHCMYGPTFHVFRQDRMISQKDPMVWPSLTM